MDRRRPHHSPARHTLCGHHGQSSLHTQQQGSEAGTALHAPVVLWVQGVGGENKLKPLLHTPWGGRPPGLSKCCHFLLRWAPLPTAAGTPAWTDPLCAQAHARPGARSHHDSRITQQCQVPGHMASPKLHLSCLRALLSQASLKQKKRRPLPRPTRPRTQGAALRRDGPAPRLEPTQARSPSGRRRVSVNSRQVPQLATRKLPSDKRRH